MDRDGRLIANKEIAEDFISSILQGISRLQQMIDSGSVIVSDSIATQIETVDDIVWDIVNEIVGGD